MRRKLSITLDEQVYRGLHAVIGGRQISRFIESLVRSHLIDRGCNRSYREMASEETREMDALEWAEGTVEDVVD